MDYFGVYMTLCHRGKTTRNLTEYTEKHHIIPKCLGGTNAKYNLCVLTFREHFIAHRLLCKIFPNESSIHYAFVCMMRKHPSGKRVLTSAMFNTIKKYQREHLLQNPITNNGGKTLTSRLKARDRMLSKNPIKMDPSKNHTATPVKIIFEDDSEQNFKYLKEASEKLSIPYATLKWLSRANKPSKKHKIQQIKKL